MTGKIQLAHYATAQGIAAAENAVSQKPHKHDTIVPNVIFTSPEVGTAGLNEMDAKKQAAVGPHATELISEATTAIRAELTVRELGRTIHAHPTFSEAWMETAHAVHGEAIHAPPKRKA